MPLASRFDQHDRVIYLRSSILDRGAVSPAFLTPRNLKVVFGTKIALCFSVEPKKAVSAAPPDKREIGIVDEADTSRKYSENRRWRKFVQLISEGVLWR